MKITYLDAEDLENKYGHGVLGYTDMDEGKVYIQKGLSKHVEKMVVAHEKKHYDKKESGPFKIKSLIGPVVAAAGVATGNPALVSAGISIYQGQQASEDAKEQADAINAGTAAASSAQERSAAAAIAEQRRQFDLARSDTQPYRDTGNRTLSALERMYLPSASRQPAPSPQGGGLPSPAINTAGVAIGQNTPRTGMQDYARLTPQGEAIPSMPGIRLSNPLTSSSGMTNNTLGYVKTAPGVTYNQDGTLAEPYRAEGSYAPVDEELLPGDTAPTAVDLESGFTESPGYGFRVSEGEKGIDRYQSRSGMRLSGRGLKEALRFNQDTASQEFGNYVNRNLASRQQGQSELMNYFNRRLTNRELRTKERENYTSRLFQLAGLGQGGVNTAVSAGTNAANNISGINQNTGNQLSNLYSNQGSNLANVYGQRGDNVNNAITSGIQNLATYYYSRPPSGSVNNIYSDDVRGYG